MENSENVNHSLPRRKKKHTRSECDSFSRRRGNLAEVFWLGRPYFGCLHNGGLGRRPASPPSVGLSLLLKEDGNQTNPVPQITGWRRSPPLLLHPLLNSPLFLPVLPLTPSTSPSPLLNTHPSHSPSRPHPHPPSPTSLFLLVRLPLYIVWGASKCSVSEILGKYRSRHTSRVAGSLGGGRVGGSFDSGPPSLPSLTTGPLTNRLKSTTENH